MTLKSFIAVADLRLLREKLDVISEENRFAITCILFAAGKPIPYSHLLKISGLSSPSLSFHLKKLTEAKIIRKIEEKKRKRGKPYIFYEITNEGKKVLKAIGISKAEKPLKEWFQKATKKPSMQNTPSSI